MSRDVNGFKKGGDMTLKLIAVDMDGTFLTTQKTYNRARFATLYARMKAQDVKFVVASGNQYAQLISFFPEIANELTFAAENGAYLVSQAQDVFAADMARETVATALSVLATYADSHGIVCGKKTAYILETEPSDFYHYTHLYYYRLKKGTDLLSAFADPDEKVVKLAFTFPEAVVEAVLAQLTADLQGALVPVSSGHGDIDLLVPEINKASSLATLSTRWGIAPADMAAFGDSGNDIEMLQYVGRGYAMANANPKVKAVADAIIGSNDADGVLDQIEQLLDENEGI